MYRLFAKRESLLVASLFACLSAFGCSGPVASEPTDSIQLGAILPFTGKEAALGRNIEQAMLLAMEDVNAAGGIDGTRLEVISRDSNSGSERGLNELLNLIYNDKVQYLVGPEETELADAIVQDVKKPEHHQHLTGVRGAFGAARECYRRLVPPGAARVQHRLRVRQARARRGRRFGKRAVDDRRLQLDAR